MPPRPFIVGHPYSHEEIITTLRVGNSGGIRVSLRADREVARVVLFSTDSEEANPRENPYQDWTEGDILTYTGSGKIGNQGLSGRNLRITQQEEGHFPIYVFTLRQHRKAAGSPRERWRFSGIYKYLDHYRESQADLLGEDRAAWIFKLARLSVAEACPALEPAIAREIARAHADPKLSARALLGRADHVPAAEIRSVVERMNRLDPAAFERFVKAALQASRFREVRVSRQSSDRGIDVTARMPEEAWLVDAQIIQVQVKRWSRPVGRREVAELRGSLMPSALGCLLTTGTCSGTAIAEASRPNLMPVSLVDGHKFAAVAIKLKLEIA